MIKVNYVKDDINFELCHKKAWSLWLVNGKTRYFITCKKKEMASLLAYPVKDFCDMLEDHIDNYVDEDVPL